MLTMDELAVRRAAAWLEYQRDHVPCSTQRQVFTGGANVTDQMARSHEMMPKLVTELDRLAKEMFQASDADLVSLRHGYKKAIDLMKGPGVIVTSKSILQSSPELTTRKS